MCKRFNHIVGNYNADPSWNGTSIFRYGGSSGTVTNNDGNYSSANFLGYLQSKLLNGAWTAV
jgi:hypothetical protein